MLFGQLRVGTRRESKPCRGSKTARELCAEGQSPYLDSIRFNWIDLSKCIVYALGRTDDSTPTRHFVQLWLIRLPFRSFRNVAHPHFTQVTYTAVQVVTKLKARLVLTAAWLTSSVLHIKVCRLYNHVEISRCNIDGT